MGGWGGRCSEVEREERLERWSQGQRRRKGKKGGWEFGDGLNKGLEGM